ncbi:MAG: pyrroline-5-carboxylate reductase [Firmicutes bacterium]|nr:pyrroline-5-carboxylate reductase [Bacillota bacterium]
MVGFIGGGAMAEALLRGMLAQGLAQANQVWVSDIDATRTSYLGEALKVQTTADNNDVLENCQIVFLAVKPQVATIVLEGLKDRWTKDHLIVSIMAGVPFSFLKQYTGPARIVRVMPNTPCLVQAGAAGIAGGPNAGTADVAKVQELLSAVAEVVVLDEDSLDAVTGLSGSAPAFVYMFIEALADGGVKAGLQRPVAQVLAAQTVFGAAKMVLETGEHPGSLKDRVTSPAGTTIAGVAALEKGGFRGLVLEAVATAAQRSAELGGK